MEDSTFKSSLSDKVVDDVYRNNSFMPDKFNQKFGKTDTSEDDELELPKNSKKIKLGKIESLVETTQKKDEIKMMPLGGLFR